MKRNGWYVFVIVAVMLSVWGGRSSQAAPLVYMPTPGCATTADYRSRASGNWNGTTTWECLSGSWIATTTSPTSASGVIAIQNGHTVTVTAGVTIDQAIVSGTLIIDAAAVTLIITDGAGIDLVVVPSGVFLNSATSGGGISATGTWQVQSGGTYIHNSTTGISSPLGKATLDPGSNFIYRKTDGMPPVSLASRTYGNLTFECVTCPWPMASASGGTPTNIKGNLTISDSVTFNNGTLAGFQLAGNWINNGVYNAVTGTVTFNGTTEQAITGTSVITFANLIITNTTGVVIPAANTPVVTGTLVNSGTLKQVQTVGASADDVKFLEFTDGAGTVKYHGVEITNTLPATSMDLVTVTVKGNQPCTTDATSKPIRRCFNIAPTTPATATIKFWYTSSELNDNNLAGLKVYHWGGAQPWITYTAGLVTGIEGSDSFIQVGDIGSFSPFVLDDSATGPTAVTLRDLTATPSASNDLAGVMLIVVGGLTGRLILRRRATRSASN
jgi:hypothetical protein